MRAINCGFVERKSTSNYSAEGSSTISKTPPPHYPRDRPSLQLTIDTHPFSTSIGVIWGLIGGGTLRFFYWHQRIVLALFCFQ